MTTKIEEIAKEISSLEKQVAEKKSTAKNPSDEFEELENRKQELAEKLENVESITLKISEAEQELVGIQNRLSSSVEQESQKQAELEQILKKSQAISSELAAKNDQLQLLLDNIALKEQELLELELQSKTSNTSEGELDKLAKLEDAIKEKKILLEESKTKTSGNQSEIHRLQSQLAEIQKDLDTHIGSNLKEQSAIEDLRSKIEEAKQGILSLSADGSSSHEEIFKLNLELSELQSESQKTQDSIHSRKAGHQRLKNDVAELKSQLGKNKVDLTQLTDINKKLTDEKNSVRGINKFTYFIDTSRG